MLFKLLIIRFSSIGDIVLTSPVIRCLNEQLEDVEIHYLTKRKFSSILDANPHVNKVYSFDKNLSEVLPELQNEKYTHIIDLHKNMRSHLVLLNLLRPYSSFNKLNIEKWLLVKFKYNLLPKVHIVARYLQAVSQLGIIDDGKGLDFFIPGENIVNLTQMPELASGYIALVIGGNHFTKLLPVDLAIQLCSNVSLPVVLLGGKEDSIRGQQIAEGAGARVFNLCGKYNLMQSASIVQQASCVVTNDTGLMHIAAAFNKPIVSIWGNTIPEFGMYPYIEPPIPSLMAEVKNLKCRPCSKIGYKECPLKHFKCMRDQDIQAIVDFTENYTTKVNL